MSLLAQIAQALDTLGDDADEETIATLIGESENRVAAGLEQMKVEEYRVSDEMRDLEAIEGPEEEWEKNG